LRLSPDPIVLGVPDRGRAGVEARPVLEIGATESSADTPNFRESQIAELRVIGLLRS
jgi:hypothetical protein